MNIELKVATLEYLEETLHLHQKYQIDTISEDDKPDGFVTTSFSKEHLKRLIVEERGLFIALKDRKVVAYAMAASWDFWSQWPMLLHMMQHLGDSSLQGSTVTVNNSYQYGPVCVDKSVRGQGVFESIFNFSLSQMSKRYPIMVSFISKVNRRSFSAHTRKTRMQVLKEFEFNNRHYYKLACKTTSSANTLLAIP